MANARTEPIVLPRHTRIPGLVDPEALQGAPPTFGGHPTLSTNLLAWWKMDEASGTRADSVGTRTLTDNNTVGSATGIISNAADFELSNSEYLSNASDFNASIGSGSFSIAGVLRVESLGSFAATYGAGVIKSYNNTNGSIGDFAITVLPTGALAFYVPRNSTGDSTGLKTTTTTPISAATTYTFFCIWDGSAHIYVDNVSKAFSSGNSLTAWNAEMTIGRFYAGAGYYFDGWIDEIGVWNKALTSGERSDLHNSGSWLTY